MRGIRRFASGPSRQAGGRSVHFHNLNGCIGQERPVKSKVLPMKSELIHFIHYVFVGAFLLTLLAGVYLYKNDHALFGHKPEHPSANSASRNYSKMQAWAIWAHLVFLTGAFALFLH